jgi:hypothetical protein
MTGSPAGSPDTLIGEDEMREAPENHRGPSGAAGISSRVLRRREYLLRRAKINARFIPILLSIAALIFVVLFVWSMKRSIN